MIVYGGVLSPFVRKVMVAAEAKGIAYEMKAPRGDAFAAASPFGLMPAIADGDFTLADSSAIVAWMEAKWPEPALLPADPQDRGRAVWFDEFADTVLFGAGRKVLFNRLVGPRFFGVAGNEAEALEGLAGLPAIYDYVEHEAARANAGSGWLVGAGPTLADIAVASVPRSLDYVGAGPDPARWPQTAAWLARVHNWAPWVAVARHEAAFARKLERA